MSGWDETITVPLDDPWAPMSISIWADPPMGAWLDLREAAAAALSNPGDVATIERAIAAFGPLVASHTLVDRAGKPIDQLTLRALPSGMFVAILRGIERVMNGGEGSGPFVLKAPSRARSSQAKSRRRATASGGSPS